MNLTKFMAAAGAALIFSSCLDSKDNELVYTMTFPSCFNVITDMSTGEISYSNGVGYSGKFNATQSIVDFTVEGLELPSNKYTSLTFSNLSWGYNDNGWLQVVANNVTPTSSVIAPTFNTLSFNILDRNVTNPFTQQASYFPCMNISYRVADIYQIYSFYYQAANVGSTVVRGADGNIVYVSSSESAQDLVLITFLTNTSVNLDKEENRRATICMYNVKLGEDADAVNLVLENMPWNASGSRIVFNEAGPLQVGTVATSTSNVEDYGDYKITNFYCTTDSSNNMILNYTISSEYNDVTYTVAMTSTSPTL